MPHKPAKAVYIFAAIAGIIIWLTLMLQFAISIPLFRQSGRTTGGAIVELLSFFTIESNLLAALALTGFVLKTDGLFKQFFSRGSVLSAITLYITIVGLVYNLVLRAAWHPVGLFKVADELLHVVNPLLYIAFWLFFVPKARLTIGNALTWLWFPLAYLFYTLIRGAICGLYPYPFMNVGKLGYQSVLINSFFVMIAFVVFGLIFWMINNRLSNKKR